ncbi:MAG: hypothetical protein PHQ59_00760 [Candidatus Daviesbacteria bacterium]|nr:hypothetical protein [Candidatus Daviesbacteria bacterium]
MKYLPLFTLGLLISCIFLFFPATIKAACTSEGPACVYPKQDGGTCQGTCSKTQNIFVCSPSAPDCFTPSTPSPSPGQPSIPPPSTPISTSIIIGAQLPGAITINRLIPSQYSFQWIKFQYSLGSSQDLEGLIRSARSASSGGGRTYQVLISVAKNTAGIETLKNPDTYPPEQDPDYFTHQYCPYDEELETYNIPYNCGTDPVSGEPQTCYEQRRAQPKSDNGYTKFRDQMEALAPRLSGASAVEVWNEPNLEDEWTRQGLGPVNPENYVNFMNCGIKGLKKGGYTGKIISAGLAPNAYATSTGQSNMNDLTFFNSFIDKGGLNNIDAIGWHANITSEIAPSDNPGDNGFKRVQHALGKGKPVWLTEFGWDRSTFRGADDYERRQLQAQYIAQAYEVADRLGGIGAMFVWNFGFTIDSPGQPEFIPWDIEGTIPRGLLCQPNPLRTTRPDRGDTTYVHDESIADDPVPAKVAGVALLPRIIIDETTQSAAQVNGTDVQVTKSFFSELLNWLSFIQNFACSTLGRVLGLRDFCTPNLSVGTTESGTRPPGKNTQQFTLQTNSLSKVSIPQGITLIPEDKDCNLGQIKEEGVDIGNQKLNELSETLGTTTGFYGNNMVDFKTTNNPDWERCMVERMKTENLNIGNKLFEQDRRSADLYCRKQVMCKGLYPNGICPFEPTPTPAR